MKLISLGHRCHINTTMMKYNMREIALPFDNIISKFEGIIHCINNNFKKFFPKIIKRERIYCPKALKDQNISNYRSLYRGKYFAFIHHDLMDPDVIDKFNQRIKRLINLLETTKDEVLFVRSVLDDNEIELVNKFIISVKKRFPKLKFSIALIYDNKNIKQKCWNYNNEFLISNSYNKKKDQNQETDKGAYQTFFNFIDKNKNKPLKKIFKNLSLFPDDLKLHNSDYKGWAIKTGVYPFLYKN